MVEVNLLGAMTATEVFLDQLGDGGDLAHRVAASLTAGTAMLALVLVFALIVRSPKAAEAGLRATMLDDRFDDNPNERR
jgi:hypothetical protein